MERYNLSYEVLRCCLLLVAVVWNRSGARACKRPAEPDSVTVPAAIDHNRVVIIAELPLPNGSTERVRAWVDNGNPELELSRRLATLLGLAVSCDDHECSSPPPQEIDGGRNEDFARGHQR